MSHVIVHSYEPPNFSKIGKKAPRPDERCEYCMLAEKTRLVDGEDGYLCKARLYDAKTLMCFVPDYEKMKDDEKAFSGLLTEDEE